MADEKPPSRVELAKNYAEVLGKLFLGLVAICYSTGLIVVNAHFSKYGLYSLNLFRLNYIMAGVWAIIPVIVLGAFVVLGFWVAAESEARSRKGKLTLGGILICVFGLLLWVFSRAMVLWPRVQRFWDIFFTDFLMSFLLVGLSGVLLVCLFRTASLDSARRLPLASFMTLGILLILIAHALLFGRATYGEIPSYLGGGMPITIRVVIEDDEKSRKLIIGSGIGVDKDSSVTDDVQCLFYTDKEYILLTTDQENRKLAVSLDRDVVKAIIYQY